MVSFKQCKVFQNSFVVFILILRRCSGGRRRAGNIDRKTGNRNTSDLLPYDLPQLFHQSNMLFPRYLRQDRLYDKTVPVAVPQAQKVICRLLRRSVIGIKADIETIHSVTLSPL